MKNKKLKQEGKKMAKVNSDHEMGVVNKIEKSEQDIQAEIILRGELESTLLRLDGEDLLSVLNDPEQVEGIPQINRILRIFSNLEKEIEQVAQDTQTYINYNEELIVKKKQQMGYLGNVMHQWMAQKSDKKTVKTTRGSLRLTTRHKVFYGDVDALMGWCKKNNVKGGVRIKEELNKKVLNEYVKNTGDAPDEELYSIKEETSFSVTTNKERE